MPQVSFPLKDISAETGEKIIEEEERHVQRLEAFLEKEVALPGNSVSSEA